MPDPRRIIQIAVSAGCTVDAEDIIYALADDGTLWWQPQLAHTELAKWHQIPSLPPHEDDC